MSHPAKPLTEKAIAREQAHAARNYQPLPVVLESGRGV